jgi:hypothetical protein
MRLRRLTFSEGLLLGLPVGFAAASLLRENIRSVGFSIADWTYERLDIFGAFVSLVAYAIGFCIFRIWGSWSRKGRVGA